MDGNPHSQCLWAMCRLCGECRAVAKGQQPIPKEKFARQIEVAFDILVGDDTPTLHPAFICKVCEVKLRQWWAKFSKKNMKSAECRIPLASFGQAECELSRKPSCTSPISEQLADYQTEAFKHGLLPWFTADSLKIMKMSSSGHPVVFVSISWDKSWQLTIADVITEIDRYELEIPAQISSSDCGRLCRFIARRYVCPGNDDFEELIHLKEGPEGQIPVSITPQDKVSGGTIRHKSCHLLVEVDSRCEVCRIHRSDLFGMLHRLKNKQGNSVGASSSAPHRSMTLSQLKQKAESLQAERRNLKRKNAALQERILTLMEEAVPLDTRQEDVIKAPLQKYDGEMMAAFPKGSPSMLMWEQQRESALKGKQMRWHPAIIRLCIALQSKSASAYNLMRESGFMRLPHPSTLHPYSHFVDASSGFSAGLLERIYKDNHFATCSEEEKNVSLLFDEMKVKSDLVYSVRSGRIVGFTDISEISNEVSNFERRCKGSTEPELASHVLVLMVRGLCSSLHVPVAYYPTKGVSSSQLYPCISEAILYLELAGLKVRSLVCDGASPNRKFFRLHGDGTPTSPVYSTSNPADPSRQLYFICDVPHLMKTTRNNLENSGYHNKTKNLMYDKQSISWLQLLQLYEWDIGLERSSPGLRRLHKIQSDHLHLSPSLRMRVYLATQMLSSTVANALESMGRPGTSSTVKFLRMMDQFFDCLNVSNPLQGMRSRKPALEPYTSVQDWRFEWLLSDFLGFFKEWDNQVQAIDGLDAKTKQTMCLSKETVEGFHITVNSFVELAKVLLSSGVKYLLSEKLNQDPLEEYFSKQRSAGGSWDNPSAEQFSHSMLSLYVASTSAKASKKGNVRKGQPPEDIVIDNTPLPKRK